MWVPNVMYDSSRFKRTLYLPPESQDSFFDGPSLYNKTNRDSQMSKMTGFRKTGAILEASPGNGPHDPDAIGRGQLDI